MTRAPVSPPAIVREASRFDTHRCRCPVCLALDAHFPGTWQLTLLPFDTGYRTTRTPRVDNHIVRRR